MILVGYDSSDVGFDGATCGVMNIIGKQSPDINRVLTVPSLKIRAPATRSLMFDYASNETDVLMPAPITFSHQLVQRRAEAVNRVCCLGCARARSRRVTCRFTKAAWVVVSTRLFCRPGTTLKCRTKTCAKA